MNRRHLLKLLSTAAGPRLAGQTSNKIDRKALVSRHNVSLKTLDIRNPLSVGNGELAFTADITGLQTFPDFYEKHIPLCTQSQWGWHSFPNPKGFTLNQFRLTEFDSHGRRIGYPCERKGQEE